MAEQAQLHRSLNSRHITMIAIGGAIGTGLFLGSGQAIHLAGPSIIIAYLIMGIATFMLMRALALFYFAKTLWPGYLHAHAGVGQTDVVRYQQTLVY